MGPCRRTVPHPRVSTATRSCPSSRRCAASAASPASSSTSTELVPRAVESTRTIGMPRRRSVRAAAGALCTSSTAASIAECASSPPVAGPDGSSSTPSPSAARVLASPSSVCSATGSRNRKRRSLPTTTPMIPLRPRRNDLATGFGPLYPSASAASSTRWRVAWAIGPAPENASDAVDSDTPAWRATWVRVTRSLTCRLLSVVGPVLGPGYGRRRACAPRPVPRPGWVCAPRPVRPGYGRRFDQVTAEPHHSAGAPAHRVRTDRAAPQSSRTPSPAPPARPGRPAPPQVPCRRPPPPARRSRPDHESVAMPSSTPNPRRAALMVFGTFVLNGVTFANWLSRIPTIRDELSLRERDLGLIILVGSLGSVLSLPLAGRVLARIGARATVLTAAGLATLGLGVAMTGIGTGSPLLLTGGLFITTMGIGGWDVAMNFAGARAEQALGRSIMPAFHGGFSIGTVLGAGLGALAIRAGIDVPLHVMTVVGVALLAVVMLTRGFLPEPEEQVDDGAARSGPPASFARVWLEPRTLMVGLVVLAAALTEG